MSPPIVAAVVVTHNGERWLNAVIDGLLEQSYPADLLRAVDTGSKDASVDIARRVLGADAVAVLPNGTSFPQAMSYAVAALPVEVEWVWIIHDDCRPAPDALANLLARVAADPQADFVGMKLREWPSLRRLLEVGITMSGTGRRETGLERGEYDQGQHDEAREVLAVHSAGMLARRTTLEALGGFDPALPIFGNDLDLGWRAAAAGYKTVVEPKAVAFHAEAAHRGLRRTALTGRHTHYAERRAALYTLLANVRPGTLPYAAVRIGFGSLLRVLGLLLTRRVGQALDELAALLAFYAHPRQIHQAREARRQLHGGDPERVRALLAPWWLPYRQGLDQLRDLAGAATRQAQDIAERRRLAKAEVEAAAAATGAARRAVHPESDDEEVPAEETGWVVRYLTSPTAIGVTVFALGMLIALRPVFDGPAGGALAAAPSAQAGAASWWQFFLSGWHALEQGTSLSAPPYVVVLAALAAVLPGGPSAAVGFTLAAAVPLAMWGAWRMLRVIGRLADPRGFPTWLLAVGSATYALLPLTSGAFGGGRLGLVVTTGLLPWLVHAALGFADPETDRRWRAGWRVGLLLTLIAAFVPSAWLLALVLGVVLVVVTIGVAAPGQRAVGELLARLAPVGVALAAPLVLLSAWWVSLVGHGAWAGLLLDSGRVPAAEPPGWQLLDGRVGDGGLVGFGATLALLAVLALIPTATRLAATLLWVLIVAVAAFAMLWSRLPLTLPAGDLQVAAPTGLFIVVWSGLFLVVVVLALGVWWLARPPGRLRLGVAVLAAVLPAVGLGWSLVAGPGSLQETAADDIPVYMTQTSQLAPERGVLVLQGSTAEGFTWAVRRDDGLRLGEDEVARLQRPDAELGVVVTDLVARPGEQTSLALAGQGIEFVVMPAPVEGTVAARLDAASGLTPASAEDRSTRAWRVEGEPSAAAIRGSGPAWRPWVLGLSALALLVALVMAGPARRTPVVPGGDDDE